MLKKILLKAVPVIIGAALMFLLNRFAGISTGIPNVSIQLGIPVLAAFAAAFGPVSGFLIGLIGHALVDLSWGGVWWSWVISSALFGFAIGSLKEIFQIQEGKFGFKQALIFNGVQAVSNIAAYVFIARILDLIFYNEPFEKISLQGFAAAGINIASVLILGTILAFAYSKTGIKTGASQTSDEGKSLVKAVGAKLILAMFFVTAFLTLFITELVNFQVTKYEATVIEMTENHLKAAVQSLANLCSAEELDLFHSVEDMERPEYEEIRERLIKFAGEYNVLYAYYERKYGDGKIQYIVDNELDPDAQSGPGDFDDEIMDAEAAALAGNISGTDLGTYSPTWEGLLSAFAPVYDRDGKVYCLAGVDISDKFILDQRMDARNMKLLQLIVVPIAVLFAVMSMMLYRKKAKEIEEAHIKLQYFNNNLRRAFSTYLSEDVVEEIVSDPTRLQLGGEKRYMTALFTDVEGFSGIAEALSPEHLVELLNFYLSTMSDVILEKEGTIDKYEGDAIVAFFGAPLNMPDHALRACTTAIAMKRLEDIVNNHVMENKLSPNPLRTRFGINSGDMVVGNMGTQKKMNYTIVSNAVNLAARLEGINKQYGTWILASEDTVKETHDRLLTRRFDRIKVVGINEPVRIYEVLEIRAEADKELQDKVYLFDRAHDLFEKRNWNDALAAFEYLLGEFPQDKPSLFYIDYCRKFIQDPPEKDWDGVFVFKEK